jgi:hypothetical protein
MALKKINAHADSLIELLIAQCRDLERLLELSRREAAALEREDFSALLETVRERATLGERLEVYHRQLAELRAEMGEDFAPGLKNEWASRAIELAMKIQAQDAETRAALILMRQKTGEQLALLKQARHQVSAYLNEGRRLPIACDRLA